MAHSRSADGSVVRSERGLRPRNLVWGEVRKGGAAPLRVETMETDLAIRAVGAACELAAA